VVLSNASGPSPNEVGYPISPKTPTTPNGMAGLNWNESVQQGSDLLPLGRSHVIYWLASEDGDSNPSCKVPRAFDL
jgi:hypothetical protein